ncbi:MAG: hypothetical protein HY437_00520 [Candidatus Magasanikbacteria bacterium]|nr:hypothetical protein [Candidatus Magasanikbacteria bacterium]
MFGFGKKKEQDAGGAVPGVSQDEKDILAKVIFHTMPKVAAAGDLTLANAEGKAAPVASDAPKKEEKKEKPIEKPAERPSLAPPPPPPAPPKLAVTPPPILTGAPPAPHGAAKIVPASASHKKLVFVVIGVIVVLILGGGGWYWYRTTRVSDTTDRGAITLSPGAVPSAGETISAPEITPPAETPPELLNDNFLADRGLISTRDSDADLLTDMEEALYGTDPELPDTDRDGWPDGWELVHLYDPAQGAAKRLTDNLLLTGFQNDDYGYAFLYPKQWVVQSVDSSDSSEVIVTSETGEFVRITAEPYGDHVSSTLDESYLRNKYQGGSTYTLHPFTNKFNVRGFETADGLTIFFEGKNTLYIMRYMPGLRTEINFKRTMAMFVAGFLVDEEVPPAIRPLIYNPGVAGFAQTQTSAPEGAITTTPVFPLEETATSSPAATPFTTSTSLEESTPTSSKQ